MALALSHKSWRFKTDHPQAGPPSQMERLLWFPREPAFLFPFTTTPSLMLCLLFSSTVALGPPTRQAHLDPEAVPFTLFSVLAKSKPQMQLALAPSNPQPLLALPARRAAMRRVLRNRARTVPVLCISSPPCTPSPPSEHISVQQFSTEGPRARVPRHPEQGALCCLG